MLGHKVSIYLILEETAQDSGCLRPDWHQAPVFVSCLRRAPPPGAQRCSLQSALLRLRRCPRRPPLGARRPHVPHVLRQSSNRPPACPFSLRLVLSVPLRVRTQALRQACDLRVFCTFVRTGVCGCLGCAPAGESPASSGALTAALTAAWLFQAPHLSLCISQRAGRCPQKNLLGFLLGLPVNFIGVPIFLAQRSCI